MWEAFPRAVGSPLDAAFRRAVVDGQPVRLETRSPSTERWVEIAAYPSADGLAVYFQDVTDRKQGQEGEARLREEVAAERTLLRAVLDQMPAGVVVAEAGSGRVLVANAPAGLPWDAFWTDVRTGGPDRGRPHDGPLDRLLARALAGETVRGADLRRDAPGGRPAWFRVNAAPVRDPDGRLGWAVLVIDDVTAEKEAEAVLQARVAEQQSALTETSGLLRAEAERRHAAERERRQLAARLTSITEEERLRISRELHDDTSQLLAALIAGLRTLRDHPGVDPVAVARLGAQQAVAEQVGRSIHRIAWELRPAALDAVGLEAALRSWAERWAGWAGLPVAFHSTLGPDRLPAEAETQIYRLVTEALANVQKHAQATRVNVLIERRKATIVVAVEDNGCGFDPESQESHGRRKGLGLLGMAERAALLGGTLHVESSPGRGTTVLARIPHSPRTEEEP